MLMVVVAVGQTIELNFPNGSDNVFADGQIIDVTQFPANILSFLAHLIFSSVDILSQILVAIVFMVLNHVVTLQCHHLQLFPEDSKLRVEFTAELLIESDKADSLLGKALEQLTQSDFGLHDANQTTDSVLEALIVLLNCQSVHFDELLASRDELGLVWVDFLLRFAVGLWLVELHDAVELALYSMDEGIFIDRRKQRFLLNLDCPEVVELIEIYFELDEVFES